MTLRSWNRGGFRFTWRGSATVNVWVGERALDTFSLDAFLGVSPTEAEVKRGISAWLRAHRGGSA